MVTDNSKPPQGRAAFPIWAWVAAVVLALVTGYAVRQMGVQTAQLADLRRQMKRAQLQNDALEVQLELGRQVSSIMLSPESKLLKLDPTDAKLPPVRAYLHPHMGVAIAADDVPAVPSTRTLQLWLLSKKGNPLSAAIFRPNSDGLVAMVAPVPVPVDEVAGLSISEEPAGGSPQPTSSPMWTAQLK